MSEDHDRDHARRSMFDPGPASGDRRDRRRHEDTSDDVPLVRNSWRDPEESLPFEGEEYQVKMGHGEKKAYYCCMNIRTISSLSALGLLMLAMAAFGVGWGSAYAHYHVGSSMMVNKSGKSVVVVSLDGFRRDYLDRGITPHLSAMAERGTILDMTPVFPTKTFPNHYTIVTGLLPGKHGIIANDFWDSDLQESFLESGLKKKDPRFWGGEPIWNTAGRQMRITGSIAWPGDEVLINGMRPMFVEHFDPKFQSQARIDTALLWLGLPRANRPELITVYLSPVDLAGHYHGPDSEEVNDAIKEVDGVIGSLLEGIKDKGLEDSVDVVVLSDHGMASISQDKVVLLDDFVTLDHARIYYGDVALIYPEAGWEEKMYANLTAAAGKSQGFDCYRPDTVPPQYQYNPSPSKMPQILCVAEVGWMITNTADFNKNKTAFDGGSHGYDNAAPEMQAMLVAEGSRLKYKGVVEQHYSSLDIYNFLAELLRITPAPNDGTTALVSLLLR